MLLSGTTGEDGPHDWIFLFERFGGLTRSQYYGRAVQVAGMLVGALALAWAALVVGLAWRNAANNSND